MPSAFHTIHDSISHLAAVALAFMIGGCVWSAHAESPHRAMQVYQKHCASCHGGQRLGGSGPALLPESLARLKKSAALDVINHGRLATQMLGYADVLEPGDDDVLVDWIYAPVEPPPVWTDADINDSRVETRGWQTWPPEPQWGADPMNLFVVVEAGDHHVSLVDGDRFEVMHRFPSRFALHGGPKFTQDGRYVFFGSRDGWITKYDLWNLKAVAEVRAGINMRNVAVSDDGRWVMAANYLPHSVVLFDGDLRHLRTYEAKSIVDGQTSRVSAVYDAAPRNSFVVALKDMGELWEIAYGNDAQSAGSGFLEIQRTLLDEPLDDFFFSQDYAYALGASRPHSDGTPSGQVVSLDRRRKVAALPIAGMPHLGSGITFDWKDTRVLASPNLKDPVISVIDAKNWRLIKEIPIPGPGFFMRSHEATPYAWTDSMMNPKTKNLLTVIDKRTLEPVARVRAPQGQTLMHIEFTRDGGHALASLWEDEGALIVLDAATFEEVKRLPMNKPVGKYNVFNKTMRSEGTSH